MLKKSDHFKNEILKKLKKLLFLKTKFENMQFMKFLNFAKIFWNSFWEHKILNIWNFRKGEKKEFGSWETTVTAKVFKNIDRITKKKTEKQQKRENV